MRGFQGKFHYIIAAFIIFFEAVPLLAGDTATLAGRILDRDSSPVQGAEVYVYNSPQVKRPADFISGRTGADGRYTVVLPGGRYWAVAVLRTGGQRFGPLGMDDKHSGESVRLDLEAGKGRELDFTVLDLREAAKLHSKRNEDIVTVSGRIVDSRGKPVAMAYAIADRRERPGDIPQYISAWTEADGGFTLYLERGRFHVGAATIFPPGSDLLLPRECEVVDKVSDLDIVIRDGP